MHNVGPVELAAVGVSIAVFNQVSRIAIFPLVSVTTSFVAEEDTIATASPVELQECEKTETGSAVNSENKKLITHTGTSFHQYQQYFVPRLCLNPGYVEGNETECEELFKQPKLGYMFRFLFFSLHNFNTIPSP